MKDEYAKRVKELHLGKRGAYERGSKLPKSFREKQYNRGVRAPGAGQTYHWSGIVLQLKRWLSKERQLNHIVDKADILDEFTDSLQRQVHLLQAKQKFGEVLAVELREYLEAAQKRLESLPKLSDKAREKFTQTVMNKMHCREGVASREAPLTADEEKKRCHLTWQEFDSKLHLAAFGDGEQLSQHVADPVTFIKNRAQTELVFADQVPFWVKIGLVRTVFAEWELLSKSKSQRKVARLAAAVRQDVQKNEVSTSDEKKAVDNEGQTQKRGVQTGDSRYRITFEARQSISGYFADGDPVGRNLPSLVVLPGVHARLDNIDDEGKWKKTEKFTINGQLIVHQAGTSARGALASYVKLRKERPELLEGLVIMQQPSATFDEVIMSWDVKDLASRLPQAVVQRDMFSSAQTDNIKKLMQISHQLPARIAPKMTPVLQLTDTDIAFVGKIDAKLEKRKIVREQRLAAVAAKAVPKFTCSPTEIVRICKAFHDGVVRRNAESQIVLAGSRRNGMLSWRPCQKEKRLVPVDEQGWAKDMPFQSHRLKTSWQEDRMKFVDDLGVPKFPDWNSMAQAKLDAEEIEKMECEKQIATMKDQVIYVGDAEIKVEIPVVELEVEAEDDSVYPKEKLTQLLHPKLRKVLAAKEFSDSSATEKKLQKQLEKQKARMATKLLNAEWQAYLGTAQIKLTRQEIADQIVPGVSGAKKKKIAVKKQLKKKVSEQMQPRGFN